MTGESCLKTRYLVIGIMGVISLIGAYLLSPAIAWFFGGYLIFFVAFEFYTRVFHADPKSVHHLIKVPDGYPRTEE